MKNRNNNTKLLQPIPSAGGAKSSVLSQAWGWLEDRCMGRWPGHPRAHSWTPLIFVGWDGKAEAFAVFTDGSVCVRFKTGKHLVERNIFVAYGVLRIFGDEHLAVRLAHLSLGHLPPAILRKPAFALPPDAFAAMKENTTAHGQHNKKQANNLGNARHAAMKTSAPLIS